MSGLAGTVSAQGHLQRQRRHDHRYVDSRLFLGGAEPTTLKELNQALGKETIDTYNTGESRGRDLSLLNHQKLGKDLQTIDELAV